MRCGFCFESLMLYNYECNIAFQLNILLNQENKIVTFFLATSLYFQLTNAFQWYLAINHIFLRNLFFFSKCLTRLHYYFRLALMMYIISNIKYLELFPSRKGVNANKIDLYIYHLYPVSKVPLHLNEHNNFVHSLSRFI